MPTHPRSTGPQGGGRAVRFDESDNRPGRPPSSPGWAAGRTPEAVSTSPRVQCDRADRPAGCTLWTISGFRRTFRLSSGPGLLQQDAQIDRIRSPLAVAPKITGKSGWLPGNRCDIGEDPRPRVTAGPAPRRGTPVGALHSALYWTRDPWIWTPLALLPASVSGLVWRQVDPRSGLPRNMPATLRRGRWRWAECPYPRDVTVWRRCTRRTETSSSPEMIN